MGEDAPATAPERRSRGLGSLFGRRSN
jgi:hypothetical protein